MKLVVVESPIKANTFQEYLNNAKPNTYKVIASGGHIKDLPTKSFAIKNDNGKFTGDYQILKGKQDFLKEVKSFVKQDSEVFICTDDDREGERIAEDIVNECKAKKYYRYAPRELRASAITEAIIEKVGIREINKNVVKGQMVRREADRILGYGLSPVIRWAAKDQNIQTHGTGRVEAIALDIIYDRHLKIESYKQSTPEATDIIKANYKLNGIPFELIGEKLEFSKQESEELENSKQIARENPHVVSLVESEIVDKEPPPPLITSSLYATASYLFEIEPSKTKKLAQDLFYCDAINYPRTDSYMINDEIVKEIVKYLFDVIKIEDHADIREKKRVYKNKKGAQAAHEAIRPTKVDKAHSPDNILSLWKSDKKTKKLGTEHLKIYELIWIYAISTQLESAKYLQTELIINSGPLVFKGKSNEPIQKGWEKYYGLKINESSKGMKDSWREREIIYPHDLHVGMQFSSLPNSNNSYGAPIIDSYERPSRSPKRISEGMLISMLETLQVARPSTMHTISSKLVNKGYVSSVSTLFDMKNSGEFVAEFNREYAPELIDRKEATAFEQTIVKIEEGAIEDTNSILKTYWEYIETVKERVAFVELEDRKPTEAQLKKAKQVYDKLSEQEKKDISDSAFNTFTEISAFIDKYDGINKEKELKNTIGMCPKCKKDSVVSREKTFSCLTNKCNFVVFKNSLQKQFLNMDKDLSGYKMDNMMKVLLRDKFVFMTELNTNFGTQDTYFELKYSKKYKNYSLSFVPKNRKNEIGEGIGLWEHLEEDKKIDNKLIDETNRELIKAKQENRRLIDASRKDALTRAFNRAALESDIEILIKNKKGKKINNLLSMVFFDGDKFKRVNDTYGHEAGDAVLIMIVNTCFKALKYYQANANVYRYGGDEFVLLYYSHSEEEVLKMTDMLRRSIASKKVKSHEDETFSISVSMGISHHIDGEDSASLKRRADEALYKVKEAGGNKVIVA